MRKFKELFWYTQVKIVRLVLYGLIIAPVPTALMLLQTEMLQASTIQVIGTLCGVVGIFGYIINKLDRKIILWSPAVVDMLLVLISPIVLVSPVVYLMCVVVLMHVGMMTYKARDLVICEVLKNDFNTADHGALMTTTRGVAMLAFGGLATLLYRLCPSVDEMLTYVVVSNAICLVLLLPFTIVVNLKVLRGK